MTSDLGSFTDLRFAGGRVAVPASGENRAPPPARLRKPNNKCQIKFKLLHRRYCYLALLSKTASLYASANFWPRKIFWGNALPASRRRAEFFDGFFCGRNLSGGAAGPLLLDAVTCQPSSA